jgi:hypothetical protein
MFTRFLPSTLLSLFLKVKWASCVREPLSRLTSNFSFVHMRRACTKNGAAQKNGATQKMYGAPYIFSIFETLITLRKKIVKNYRKKS